MLLKTVVLRANLFITTKLWNTHHTYEDAQAALKESLDKLGLDYIDLYLIHWPNPKPLRDNDAWKKRNAEVWRAMEDMLAAGRFELLVLAIFCLIIWKALLETARVIPAVTKFV